MSNNTFSRPHTRGQTVDRETSRFGTPKSETSYPTPTRQDVSRHSERSSTTRHSGRTQPYSSSSSSSSSATVEKKKLDFDINEVVRQFSAKWSREQVEFLLAYDSRSDQHELRYRYKWDNTTPGFMFLIASDGRLRFPDNALRPGQEFCKLDKVICMIAESQNQQDEDVKEAVAKLFLKRSINVQSTEIEDLVDGKGEQYNVLASDYPELVLQTLVALSTILYGNARNRRKHDSNWIARHACPAIDQLLKFAFPVSDMSDESESQVSEKSIDDSMEVKSQADDCDDTPAKKEKSHVDEPVKYQPKTVPQLRITHCFAEFKSVLEELKKAGDWDGIHLIQDSISTLMWSVQIPESAKPPYHSKYLRPFVACLPESYKYNEDGSIQDPQVNRQSPQTQVATATAPIPSNIASPSLTITTTTSSSSSSCSCEAH